MSVVTRFAPSLSGHLHIGSVKVALINWLFSKKNNGRFILRIDDTNANENKIAKEVIINDLEKIGIANVETFIQSERLDIYRKFFDKLCAAGLVLIRNEENEEVYYFLANSYAEKIFGKAIKIDDVVYGTVRVNVRNIKDYIIGKENKFFYNFCSVVDDVVLGITHVIRGADHLSNTFHQIPLFHALGRLPQFVHIPNILIKHEEEEKFIKLSKKFHQLTLNGLLEEGITLEVLTEVLLGNFDGQKLEDIPSANSKISLEHLLQANARAWKKLTNKKAEEIIGVPLSEGEWVFLAQVSENKKEAIEALENREASHYVELKHLTLSGITKEEINNLKKLINEKGWKEFIVNIQTLPIKEKLFLLLRLVLTGKKVGPSFDEYVAFFGEEKIKQIMDETIKQAQ